MFQIWWSEMIKFENRWRLSFTFVFFYRFENRWSDLHTHSFDQVFFYKNNDFIKSFNSISIKHLTSHQTITHQHISSACDFSAIDIFLFSYKPNEPQVRSYFILIQEVKQTSWWKKKYRPHAWKIQCVDVTKKKWKFMQKSDEIFMWKFQNMIDKNEKCFSIFQKNVSVDLYEIRFYDE